MNVARAFDEKRGRGGWGIFDGPGWSYAGLGEEGKNYDVVEWTDLAWPTTREDALAKLWDMYKYCKKKRIEDNLMNSFDIHTLKEEKIKLQATYERNMKLKLANEKRKLQIEIIELEKVVEQIKVKSNGIKAILDE
ncbi:hypothetical protein D1007_07496 [Hordeum vulgare]|nr:hypothetical protein D1007_07496 [Hordeum vulgare]